MKSTAETAVKRQVKDWLRWKGWFYFHIQQGLGSYKGIPDLIAVKDGVVLFIEVKAPNGKLTPDQKKFKKDLEEHGGKYIVARDYRDIELAAIAGIHLYPGD